MEKINLEKLLCSLTNSEIVGAQLASCFQDALREQGLVCEDGKIKTIWNFVNDNDEPYTETVNDEAFGVEIKKGNYYRCLINIGNQFTKDETYYSPNDCHLINDNGDDIEWGDRTCNFELASRLEAYGITNPPHGIKEGNYYDCTYDCMGGRFISGRTYYSDKDGFLMDEYGDSVGVIPVEACFENHYFFKVGEHYYCIKDVDGFELGKEYYCPKNGTLVDKNGCTPNMEVKWLNFILLEDTEYEQIKFLGGNYYRCITDMKPYGFTKGFVYWAVNDNVLYNDEGQEANVEHLGKFFILEKETVCFDEANELKYDEGDWVILSLNNKKELVQITKVDITNHGYLLNNVTYVDFDDEDMLSPLSNMTITHYTDICKLDVDKMVKEYTNELGNEFTRDAVIGYKKGIIDALKKLDIANN